jgi:pimeloyl-ACP methyl ester carboxylesterase
LVTARFFTVPTFEKNKMHRIYPVLFIVLFLPVLSSAQFVKKVLVDGKGAPIVMLPGGTADISVFEPHAKELSKNHKVIRMEHFNVQFADQGRTLPSDYSVETESEAIGRTLDSLMISEPVVLVGWSYGAVIALDFALHHRERIASLILSEPPSFWIAQAKRESPQGMQRIIDLTSRFSPLAVITEQDVKDFRCSFLNCDSIDITKLPQWATWLKQKDRLKGMAAVSKYTNKIEILRHFGKPVLIINGSSTVIFHRRINELLAAELPNAVRKEIPGGHNAPIASPQEFIECITNFIKW